MKKTFYEDCSKINFVLLKLMINMFEMSYKKGLALHFPHSFYILSNIKQLKY